MLLAGLPAGCDTPIRPEGGLLVGTVVFYEEPVFMELSDTGTAGQPFAVTVRTYGGGCERLGPTKVGVLEDGLRVAPRNWTAVDPDVACPTELELFDHPHLVHARREHRPDPGAGGARRSGAEVRADRGGDVGAM